ncbi:two component transcriptional regulator, winged helix family [Clostridium bornimense]|uniref:Stage 0 sporulation protein A homolog n=1 Tax=Clostridium bornimense TaxID=1216932 RepID=W6RRX9_9CLOT|nr:response regulator transcription factor [Clostridium bornimense]CDM67341.1 two component transcriptional regulator, winged helix family [Clostridium bornimense]
MKINILVVDDEVRIRDLLGAYLTKEGYNIFYASNGKEALDIFKDNIINFVILDVMMPIMDGIVALKEMRKIKNVPTLMLTAKSEEEDMLLAYGIGADDYETKPFSPKVLVAKINAMIKRNYNVESEDLVIDEEGHRVLVDGKEVSLSKTEFDLLKYFVANEGIVLSRDRILDKVWGYDFEGDLRAVDTGIKRLREKLKDKASYINTVRGVGYKYERKEEN